MIGSYTANNNVAVLVPVIVLGVPIFDTLFVMYVRRRRGISMFLGSPDHFALRLRRWDLTKRQTVLLSYIMAVFLAVAGIVVMTEDTAGALMIIVLLLLFFLFAAYRLKRIDMGL
jgi:UDP-GlcNAc:undecaprenyl-phosphate GlcNAc-1-phosphate transferase